MIGKEAELFLAYAGFTSQIIPQGVIRPNTPAQEVECEPAALVLELCLIGEQASAEDLSQVVRLDQFGSWVDLAYAVHRKHHGAALVEQCLGKRSNISPVGVPVPVQTTEASRGEWLVHRRIVCDPGIPPRDGASILGKQERERRIQQIGESGAAPVMNQAYNRGYSQCLQPAEPLVRPGPIGAGQAVRGGFLPEYGVAQCPDAQRGKAVQIPGTIGMTRTLNLVEVPVPYAVDRTLDATPNIRKREVVVPKHVSHSFRHSGVRPPHLLLPGGFSIVRPGLAKALVKIVYAAEGCAGRDF
jgi:hypothetical protein